jgi:hypothetical protein
LLGTSWSASSSVLARWRPRLPCLPCSSHIVWRQAGLWEAASAALLNFASEHRRDVGPGCELLDVKQLVPGEDALLLACEVLHKKGQKVFLGERRKDEFDICLENCCRL